MEERHLSLSEAADALDISMRTAYRWVKSGKLRAYKPGRDYWIPESAVREIVETSIVRPKVPAPSPELPLTGFEDERRVVRGSAHLRGTGKLEAAGERIMQVVKRHAAGELSYEEAEAKVGEILAEVAA